MKRLLAFGARVAYCIGYPVFGLYLHNSRRTRVLLMCDNALVLHRSYGGLQKWSLPGGGIHKNENAINAALREVKEEVGLTLHEADLTCLGEDRLPVDRVWPRYAAVFYVAHLQKKHPLTIKRPFEVIEARWCSLDALPKNISPSVAVALKHYAYIQSTR